MIPRLRLLLSLPVLYVLFAGCGTQEQPLFRMVSSQHSGIHFVNQITENDSVNPIDLEFLYNGGGVAVGDFNNDGLPDLYFTASMVSNKLYLNKGHMTFEDITAPAGVSGEGEWFNAASVVDINNDGLEDIYLCATIKSDPQKRKNLLYVNQGVNKEGIPVFKEMAAEYGLADTSYSVHAAFFDYDNDGDLDMYLLTTQLAKRDAARFSNGGADSNRINVDKLYRNDWNPQLGHPVFTDVSKEAGIHYAGFGLGVSIADINRDGWKDIYVSNDFYGSDFLYINNHDGTFTNRAREIFRHTSQNAMGNDIADINNDGLADMVTVDMNPEDNYRKKKNMNGNNYYVYQSMQYQGLVLQYVRNTLQLNMGPSLKSEDSISNPVFSDIGFYAGVAQTDWSWNPSLADFDNDGYRDLLITNGYPKDVTDHDFVAYRNETANIAPKDVLISMIPQVKIPNYAYRNNGHLHFDDVTKAWGMDQPSFSNGAVYVDLDNDGDLDYVVNNINQEAFVYENTLDPKTSHRANYLDIVFRGNDKNRFGIGAWAEIYYNHGQMQVYENSPYRGYLSTGDTKAYFGLDSLSSVDSVVIRWPSLRKQVIKNVKANQVLQVEEKNASEPDSWSQPAKISHTVFTDISPESGIRYVHREMDYIDFDRERLLPHKFSQYGPGLAAGDIDGNGLDDIYVGGNENYPGEFLLQQPNGQFREKELPLVSHGLIGPPENMGLLFFDADHDGDLDLFCANGSNEYPAGSKAYQDQLYLNDGKGNFSLDSTALPLNLGSKSCVKAVDFDNDGDLDLFIGGRVNPQHYPQPVSSFIYRNDSKPGAPKFTDVTREVAGSLLNIGLTCDAIWTDFDNDGWTDLVLAGEWMPIRFFKNEKGHLKDVTASSGIDSSFGWWTSIAGGDFDNDGDVDFIVGNLGENSFYHASTKYPVRIYGEDFDGNGSFDAIPTLYLKDQQGKLKEYTAHNRDDIIEQLPPLKRTFNNYKKFAEASFDQLFTPEQLKKALVLHANDLQSAYIENLGNGKFKIHPLPVMAQMAPLYGMVVDDFNGDGNLDVALNGNDYGTEVTTGRYDALDGLLLLGDGKGHFQSETIQQSGLYIPGDGKALVALRGAGNKYLLAASQNRGPLKLFSCDQAAQKMLPLQPDDQTAWLTLANGKRRKVELYYGNSFLSQSARFLRVEPDVKKVEIENSLHQKREIQ